MMEGKRADFATDSPESLIDPAKSSSRNTQLLTIHESLVKRTSDTNKREFYESRIKIHQNRLAMLRK